MPKASDAALVSVLIPTYNHGRFVRQAVESALGQSYRPVEVIVIDDGSTDDTPERLSGYGDRILAIRKSNAGLSAARNTGIAAASGRYLAILDADDVWMPEKLARQMAVFDEHPETGVVGCSILQVDEELRPLEVVVYEDPTDQQELRRRLLSRNVVSNGSGAVIRRECVEQVGGFDEALTSAEDWDLWLRISRRWPIRIVTDPLVQVRMSRASMSSVGNADRMLENELVVLHRHVESGPDPRAEGRLLAEGLSYRHFAAAWAHWQGGRITHARRHMWRALRLDPRSMLRRPQAGLLLKVLLGASPS